MDDAQVARKLAKDGEPMLFPHVRSAYAEEPVSAPKSIADMLATRTPKAAKSSKRTERDDLLTYFHERITNKQGKRFPIAFIATKLSYMKVPDLYHLKSVCEQETGRKFTDRATGKEITKTFGMVFWSEIKAK